MRGLIEHERQQRTRHYLKSAAECTSRAIVSLELSDESVRSVSQARQLEGVRLSKTVSVNSILFKYKYIMIKQFIYTKHYI